MKSHYIRRGILVLLATSLYVLQLARAFQCSVKLVVASRAHPPTNRIPFHLKQTQQDDESSSNKDSEATYYSPNIALDECRYRYDLDDDNDTSVATFNSTITTSSSVNEYSFFDEATIYVRAGSGGQGASTYKKGIHGQDGPPDGGNGGTGGNVVLVVDESLNTLASLTNAWRPNSFGGSGAASFKINGAVRPRSFRAENGENGKRQFKNGKYGKDVVIRVPPGTVVQEEIDVEGDNEETSIQLVDLGSLTVEDRTLVVAQGGQGGEGTGVAGKVSGRGVRRPRVPPQGGEKKRLKLTLKIVADVALVGVPNCGKSTFLAAVTRAKPKIANYPFTTVVPNLGVWIPPSAEFEGGSRRSQGVGSSGLVLCDVPGLIAGAAQGVGLGHAFLRHVERCHVILHLIDATSNDPIADFEMLNREVIKYGSGQLAHMPQVVVVNKVDVFDSENSAGEEWEEGLQTRYSREELEAKLKESMSHSRLMWMSAKERNGVDDLMKRMAGFVKKVKDAE